MSRWHTFSLNNFWGQPVTFTFNVFKFHINAPISFLMLPRTRCKKQGQFSCHIWYGGLTLIWIFLFVYRSLLEGKILIKPNAKSACSYTAANISTRLSNARATTATPVSTALPPISQLCDTWSLPSIGPSKSCRGSTTSLNVDIAEKRLDDSGFSNNAK